MLLTLTLVCSIPASAKGHADFDARAYAAAVAKAEVGDPNVDYVWLRKQASAQLAYAEQTWADWRKADQLVETDPEQSLHMARARMSVVWTDFLPHIVAGLASEKLGKHDDAERERGIVGAIFRSIRGGHKGTGAEDAFNAVSVAEEYRTLFELHWKSDGQSLVRQGGHSFDVFDVTDLRTNQRRQAWFNIDVFFGKELGL